MPYLHCTHMPYLDACKGTVELISSKTRKTINHIRLKLISNMI